MSLAGSAGCMLGESDRMLAREGHGWAQLEPRSIIAPRLDMGQPANIEEPVTHCMVSFPSSEPDHSPSNRCRAQASKILTLVITDPPQPTVAVVSPLTESAQGAKGSRKAFRARKIWRRFGQSPYPSANPHELRQRSAQVGKSPDEITPLQTVKLC